MPARKKQSSDSMEQYRRFVEKAEELGCESDEREFEKIVRKVVTHKPAVKKPATRGK